MRQLKVKVCGNTEANNLQQVCSLNPDYVGFIFYDESKRFVESPAFVPKVEGCKAKRVGVFVNVSVRFIQKKVRDYKLDIIQLHGDETHGFCQKVSKVKPVFKAFQVHNNFNFRSLSAYLPVCSKFLFDTSSATYGGSGKKFDWDTLNYYTLDKPFFLSGGIGPEDAHKIRKLNHPMLMGIDLNSRFETEPGIKNIEVLSLFITTVTRVNSKHPTKDGFYGGFGGAFIPEMLHKNVEELKTNYLTILASKSYQNELAGLLKNYVGRPTPLYKAKNLSTKYGATIFLKREDLNHTGAHKINNALGQILLAIKMGKTSIIAETGAGQHGVATATACALFGLPCKVFMGELDIERQAPNVARMKMLGAEVIPATSGSKTLKDATNEAIRYWIANPETYYLIGSVVGPHPYPDLVARLQAVISKEIKEQLSTENNIEQPDYVIACVGGGSNAAGAFYHFIDNEDVKLVAVEAAGKGVHSGKSAATFQLGSVGVIHGNKTLVMQTSEGQIIEPFSISAGLDYPGIGPMLAELLTNKRGIGLDATDAEALVAAELLTRLEGIIPALESAHAIAALEKIQFNPTDTVVVNLSGRGDKDMATYMKHFKNGK